MSDFYTIEFTFEGERAQDAIERMILHGKGTARRLGLKVNYLADEANYTVGERSTTTSQERKA